MIGNHREVILDSRILIVDDKVSNIVVTQRVLQQGGYQNVTSTTDPREVIDQLRVFRPDLIVLDLMMPKVDGYSVIVQLRGWIPDNEYLPILVVTADVSRAARQKALTLGANDFITKPVDAIDLTLRVYNLLQTQRLYRQIRHQNTGLIEQVFVARHYLQEAQVEIAQLEEEPTAAVKRIAVARGKLAEAVASIEQLVEPLEPPMPAGEPVTPQ